MNAVNLMPDRTAVGTDLRLPVSRPFLGLVAALGAVLVATILFVSAHDTVTSREAELHRVQAATSRWTAAAAAFDPSVQADGTRAKTITEVRRLATARYDWSALLRQIAGRLPAHAALSSLQATAPSSASASASGAAASGTATTTTGTAATTATGIQISACATSQTVVAQTMTSLRHVSGVSKVTLGSSGTGTTGTTGTSTAGAGSCALPVQFSIVLTFGSSAAATPAASAGSVVGTEAANTEPAR